MFWKFENTELIFFGSFRELALKRKSYQLCDLSEIKPHSLFGLFGVSVFHTRWIPRYSRLIPFLGHLLNSRFKIGAIRSSTLLLLTSGNYFWFSWQTFLSDNSAQAEDTFIIEQDPSFYQLMKHQVFILHNFLSFTGMSNVMFIAL